MEKDMNKEFIPYEDALALKELGFDEPCFGFYDDMDDNNPKMAQFPAEAINSAPLYQQAFRWFRETWNLFVEESIGHDHGRIWYDFSINKVEFSLEYEPIASSEGGKPYDEMRLDALRALINIVKDYE
jgi:hypothetical protein